MAVDTRPYKSKEQDGNGNEIIIRDQQLVEQSSQTTMASTEYFEIVDVDGRMAKIPKDNMIGVVREALGSLLNGLADQTTVAKFLTLNGNTLGASAAATAASVLGATIPGPSITTGNLNDYTTPVVGIVDNRTGSLQNVPSSFTSLGMLRVSHSEDKYSVLQEIFTTQSNTIHYHRHKWGNSWSDWTISYDDSVLNNSAVMSPLASALGGNIGISVGTVDAQNPTITKSQLNYGFLFYTLKGGSSYRPALYSIGKDAATQVYAGVGQPSFTVDSSYITFQDLESTVYYMYIKLMG